MRSASLSVARRDSSARRCSSRRRSMRARLFGREALAFGGGIAARPCCWRSSASRSISLPRAARALASMLTRVPLDVGRRDGGDQHAEDHRDRELQRQRHVDRVPAAPALGHVGHALEGRRRRHRDRLCLGARPFPAAWGSAGAASEGLSLIAASLCRHKRPRTRACSPPQQAASGGAIRRGRGREWRTPESVSTLSRQGIGCASAVTFR